MSIGRGATGLLSGLRTYADLLDDSGASRDVIVDFSPGVELPAGAWVHDGLNVYRQRVHYPFDHRVLDVVGVETMVEPRPLVRVESLSFCQSLPGSYFYDPDLPQLANGPWWDDNLTSWDQSGAVWDSGTNAVDGVLYVHLPDESNPSNTTTVALLGLNVSSRPQILPVLGPNNKLGDPGLDKWTGAGNLPNWIETTNVSQCPPLVGSAGYGMEVSGSMAAGTFLGVEAGAGGIKNCHYIAAGDYWTSPNNPAQIEARIRVLNSAGVYLTLDGRETNNSAAGLTLANTYGEVRRFCFVFRCPATVGASMSLAVGAFNTGGGAASGVVRFDNLHFRRVQGYRFYEGRLSAESVPTFEETSLSIFWAERAVSLGALTILNADGRWDKALGSLILENKPVRMAVGGTLSDGQDLTRDAYQVRFDGLTQRAVMDDMGLQIQLEDQRNLGHVMVPPNVYPNSSTMEPNKIGSPKPICLAFSFVRPVRVDVTSDGYGVYEMVDGALGAASPFGVVGDGVFVYATEENAQRELFEYLLTQGTHYSLGSNNTRFTILKDVRNYKFTRDGTQVGDGARFNFDVGGAMLTAAINMVGPAATVAADLQAAMRAVPGSVATIDVTYNETTHKFRVRRSDAGAINLRGETGPDASFNYWQYLGFKSGDKTTTNDYTSESTTFDDPDRDHIIRVLAYGYIDDASGTITGVANSLIKKHAHCAFWILNKLMGVPTSKIDKASFDAAAALETGASGANNDHAWLYLTEKVDAKELLSRIQAGLLADFVVDGEGIWYLRPYDLSPGVVAEFFDRDYLEFSLTRDPENVYRRTRVYSGYSPNRGRWVANESIDFPQALVKYGRLQTHEVYTMIASTSTNPDHRPGRTAQRMQNLSQAAPRVARFKARGKLVALTVGDKIALTKTRAMDPSGNLSGVVFRVQSIRMEDSAGFGSCVAVEDIPI